MFQTALGSLCAASGLLCLSGFGPVKRWWLRRVGSPARRRRTRIANRLARKFTADAETAILATLGAPCPLWRRAEARRALTRHFESMLTQSVVHVAAVVAAWLLLPRFITSLIASLQGHRSFMHSPWYSILKQWEHITAPIGKFLLPHYGWSQLAAPLAFFLLLLAGYRWARFDVSETHRSQTPSASSAAPQKRHADWSGVAMTLATATRCARQHASRLSDRSLDTVPSVSLRLAERAIRRAHLSPLHRLNRRQRTSSRRHAARVIGTLREQEVRLLAQPELALQRLTELLVTIAFRLSQGQIGQLLDESDLHGDAPPSHPVLRWLLVGVVTGATTASMVWLEWPPEVIGTLSTVIAVTSIMLVYGGSRPTDAVEILRVLRNGG